MTISSDSARRAAEAARRRAEEARRKAAEAARAAAAAKKAAAAKEASKKKAAAAKKPKGFGKDELSTGKGSAHKKKALAATGAAAQAKVAQVDAGARPTLRATDLLRGGQVRLSRMDLPTMRPMSATLTGPGPAGVAGAPNANTRAQAREDAKKVQKTYDDELARSRGNQAAAANAAAQQMRSLTQSHPNDPAYARELIAASGPTLDKMAKTYGENAKDSKHEGSDADKKALRDSLRALSDVAAVAGRDGARDIGNRLARELPDSSELEQFDDAFAEHIDAGGNSLLMQETYGALHAAGKGEAARRLEQAPEKDLAAAAAEDYAKGYEAVKDDPVKAQQYVDRNFPAVANVLANNIREHDDDGSQKALETIANVSDGASPEVTRQMAKILAQELPEQSDLVKFDDKLHDLAGDGRGVNLSINLVQELSAAGKTQAAAELSDVVTRGIGTVRGRYEDAQKKVDELNKELSTLVNSYTGVLTPDQMTAAVSDFQKRHQEDYDRLEAEAKRAGAVLNDVAQVAQSGALANLPEDARGAIQKEAQRALVNIVPQLDTSVAGSQVMNAAMDAQSRGEPNFLDAIKDLKLTDQQVDELASGELKDKGIKDWTSFTKGVGEVAFKAATLRVMTNPEQSRAILDGLANNADLLGVNKAQLQKVLGKVEDLALADDPAVRTRLAAELKDDAAKLKALDPKTRLGQAFGAFTTVLGAAAVINGIQGWSEADLKARIQTVAGAMNTGLGGFSVVSNAAGLAAKMPDVLKVAGKAGGVLGGVGVVLDGISAVEAFQNGDYVGGAASSMTAIGGGILAVAAVSNVVPVAGQIAAGVLVAVGFGLSLWAGSNEANKMEGPSEDFLRGAGLSPKLAEELSNHGGDGFPPGPAIAEVARKLNLPPEKLIAHLETLSESQLQTFIEKAVHPVELEGEGEDAAFPATGDDVQRIRDWKPGQPYAPYPPEPDSIEGLALWMERMGVLPPGYHA